MIAPMRRISSPISPPGYASNAIRSVFSSSIGTCQRLTLTHGSPARGGAERMLLQLGNVQLLVRTLFGRRAVWRIPASVSIVLEFRDRVARSLQPKRDGVGH